MRAAGFEPEGGRGVSRFDMIHHAEQGDQKNKFDMKNRGSCVQSAPNSWLKQIQLQLAS